MYNNTFNWFHGVVEDINDPEEMGRVRVRCYGYHTEDIGQLSTEELPWAFVMMPITSAAMSEIGQSPTGVLQGSWVVGFFRDGESAQDPIIMGTLASKSSAPDYQKGFSDPEKRYPTKLGVSETPLSAKEEYKKSFPYIKKKELRSLYDGVETAVQSNWNFPNLDSVVAPKYPKNHVTSYEKRDDQDEASHTVEIDVTPNHERISTIHRSGTYNEITPDGDQTCVVVGKEFKVVVSDSNVSVLGNCNLTVESNCNTYIKGDWNIKVDGDISETIGGSKNTQIANNLSETIGGNQATQVDGNVDIDASRIDLN
jgi:hypothetical protein